MITREEIEKALKEWREGPDGYYVNPVNYADRQIDFLVGLLMEEEHHAEDFYEDLPI
jgi:hypothetical protein